MKSHHFFLRRVLVTSIVLLEMILYGDHSYDWWAVMTQGVPGQLCTPNSVPMVFSWSSRMEFLGIMTHKYPREL